MTAAAGRSPLDFLWFLPSAGDQRYLASTDGARAATPRTISREESKERMEEPRTRAPRR